MEMKLRIVLEFMEAEGKKSLWTSLSGIGSMAITQIGLQDFEVLKQFSAGAYSRIYLVRKIKTGDLFAMKVMKKDDLMRKNVIDSVLLEKDILNQSHNKNIVKLYYAFQDAENLYLVMEYCPGGDLAGLLLHVGRLEEHVAKVYAAEIITALQYIHQTKCVHRDLKPDNVLIDRKGHLVLTDFGLSTVGSLSSRKSSNSKVWPA